MGTEAMEVRSPPVISRGKARQKVWGKAYRNPAADKCIPVPPTPKLSNAHLCPLMSTPLASNVQTNKPVTHQTALAGYCNRSRELLLLPEAGEQAILLAGVDHMMRRLSQDPSRDRDACKQPARHTTNRHITTQCKT